MTLSDKWSCKNSWGHRKYSYWGRILFFTWERTQLETGETFELMLKEAPIKLLKIAKSIFSELLLPYDLVIKNHSVASSFDPMNLAWISESSSWNRLRMIYVSFLHVLLANVSARLSKVASWQVRECRVSYHVN